MPSDIMPCTRQVHHLLHRWTKDDLKELVGLGNDLTTRPRGAEEQDARAPGGARRGADEVDVCRAFFKAVNKLSRAHTMSAYIRLGYIDRAEAPALLSLPDADVQTALDWLASSQVDPDNRSTTNRKHGFHALQSKLKKSHATHLSAWTPAGGLTIGTPPCRPHTHKPPAYNLLFESPKPAI